MSTPTASKATHLLKRELRKHIRAALASLPPASIEAESRELSNRFLRSPAYQNASSIALYASMPQELNTQTILTQAFVDSKRVFLPRVVSKENNRMLMLECNNMSELLSWTPNSWNIREPPLEDNRAQSPRDAPLDVVLIPGLAFDMHGGRCGQGMGFYDHFLASYAVSSHRMPYLVALALSIQIVDSVPMSDTDWKIDEVMHCYRH